MASIVHSKRSDYLFAYLLLTPALLVLTFVIVIPLFEAIGLSFTRTSLINFSERTYVGLDNYRRLLADRDFWVVLSNTIFIVFVSVGISVLVGGSLALVLDGSSRMRLLRGIFIIPWLIPGVVIGIIWKWILATEGGVINYFVRSLGLSTSNIPFLSHAEISPWVVVIVFVWSSVPYIMVTTLAGLQAVPQELDEAAIIDGAKYGQRFRYVTLPLVVPVVSIAVVLRVIYTMQDFAIIFSLTQGGPGNATETFVLHVYKTAFNAARIGLSCAIGTLWLLFLLVFIVMYFRLFAKEGLR